MDADQHFGIGDRGGVAAREISDRVVDPLPQDMLYIARERRVHGQRIERRLDECLVSVGFDIIDEELLFAADRNAWAVPGRKRRTAVWVSQRHRYRSCRAPRIIEAQVRLRGRLRRREDIAEMQSSR